jgi:hypothetical protein
MIINTEMGACGMYIALSAGMDRLERHYLEEAAKLGVDLRVFTRSEAGSSSKIRNVEAMVIFTNEISHQVKKQAVNRAKANDIPVFMHHHAELHAQGMPGLSEHHPGRNEECVGL